MYYRKKPVVIEAIQFVGNNVNEVLSWMMNQPGASNAFDEAPVAFNCNEDPEGGPIAMTTVHDDTAYARVGTWIIPDAAPGTFYPCDPNVFKATYEQVDGPGN
jgi:hypothetical protein